MPEGAIFSRFSFSTTGLSITLSGTGVGVNAPTAVRTVTPVAANVRSNRPITAVSPATPAVTLPSSSTVARRSLFTANTPRRVTSRFVPSVYSATSCTRCDCPFFSTSLSGTMTTRTTCAGSFRSEGAPCVTHVVKMVSASEPRANREPPSWRESPRAFATSRLFCGTWKLTRRPADSFTMPK